MQSYLKTIEHIVYADKCIRDKYLIDISTDMNK